MIERCAARHDVGIVVPVESPTAALRDLLLSLFSEYELRSWFANRPENGPQLAVQLPGQIASFAHLADEAAQLMVRRGLATPAVFEALRVERPSRAADIERVANLWRVLPKQDQGSIGPGVPHAEPWDVFIAYAKQDVEWVTILAENLHSHGVKVFFDEWQIGGGEVVSRRLEQAVRDSHSGILVVSPTSVASPWVMEAYAMLLHNAIERSRRLVPVLYDDAEVPPMLATRRWVDLRGKKGEAYLETVWGLVKALRGEPPGPPRIVGPPRTP